MGPVGPGLLTLRGAFDWYGKSTTTSIVLGAPPLRPTGDLQGTICKGPQVSEEAQGCTESYYPDFQKLLNSGIS